MDSLTNDTRGTRTRPAVSPRELVGLVDRLRWAIKRAGAVGVVVCQIKPMQTTDVTPYNILLDEYLRYEQQKGRGGHGCRTQISLDSLKPDGFHVKSEFDSVIDKTYACAILGIHVPCPTPPDQFVPFLFRRRTEQEWPRLGQRGQEPRPWREIAR